MLRAPFCDTFSRSRHAGMSIEISPSAPARRLAADPPSSSNPTGIVTGKSPDRQRRQFLNYSFYRLDPLFRRLPADEQRAAAAGFIELVRTWESSDDLILRTYSLVGLRADVDFMLWRIAFDPLCFQAMEAAIRRSRAGRLPGAGAQLPVAAAPVAVRQQDEGRRGGGRAAARPGQVSCSSTRSSRRGRGTGCRRTRARG